MTSPPSPAPKAPGWEILGRLGSGSMGVVWKARRADGTFAALKVMKSGASVEGRDAGSLFRREALACFNLDHPNLVRGLDAGVTEDGRAYIALAFVEGRTLAAEVRASGALDEKRVVAIGAALAKALAHAHRLGLVHRDVKPSNVMLSPDGGVKLLDLGLVVETAEGAGRHGLGTFGFAAPEIVAGEKAGPRADLFSLGATLAVAATGEVPTKDRGFADRTLPATAGGRPLSPEFRTVVERLLRSEAAARYGSAAELVLDLDALAAGERPLGAILGAGAARVVRRGPRVAAVLVLAALGAAGVWWIATRPAAAPHAEPLPPPPVAPAPAPAATRNAKLDAAKVFLDQFPGDLARGREVLAAVDEAALTPGERVELDELRASLASRADAAALVAWKDAEKRAADAEAAGDFVASFEIVAASRDELRGSRYAEQAERNTQRLLQIVQKDARVLLEETKLALISLDAREAGAVDTARVLRPRLDAALARRRFDGDRRADIADASDRLAAAVGSAAVAETTTRAAAEQMARLRCAVADHVARPSAERLHAVLDAANFDAVPTALRESSRKVAAAWDRAEAAVGASVAGLKGKPWCGPLGNSLFVGLVTAAPSADDVFLSPLWSIAGDGVDALTAAAGGADEAAAWLLARGRFGDALERSGPAGGVTALLAGARLPPPPRADVASVPGFTAALALRGMGSPADAAAPGDRVADAWKASVSGKPRPPAPPAARNPAKAAGRDAFLKDDLAAAATALTDAMNADPWDAEVAALRGRVFLVGARTLPTAPALLVAYSEGRRAWDLDPKMPAGPVLAAEAGIELSEVAGRDLAERNRPIVAAACDAAAALGREDARMLAFAAEWRLQGGRTAEAVALLRRAVAKEPGSGLIALALARAEHAAGHDDKAKAALHRARELLGGNLPASAADLARALGE